MNIEKLCRVADQVKSKMAPSKDSKNTSPSKMFEGVPVSPLKRVSDSNESELKKIKDELESLKKENEEQKISIDDLEEKNENIKQLFESERAKSRQTIERLTQVISDLQDQLRDETEISLNYDGSSLKGVDGVDKGTTMSILASTLKSIFPDKQVSIVFDSRKVKDSSSELEKYVSGLNSYLNGTVANIPDVDIDALPESVQPFVKELVAGNNFISQEAYEEYAPAFKEALSQQGLAVESLPLLVDSLTYEGMCKIIKELTPEPEKVLDSIVGTPSAFKISRVADSKFVEVGDLYINY